MPCRTRGSPRTRPPSRSASGSTPALRSRWRTAAASAPCASPTIARVISTPTTSRRSATSRGRWPHCSAATERGGLLLGPAARAFDGAQPGLVTGVGGLPVGRRHELGLLLPHGGHLVERAPHALGQPREVGGAEGGRLLVDGAAN